jgi:hypothetical protein
MSNTWDEAQALAEKHAASGGLFVKLANDGDKVVGIFLGDPYPREVHWDGERYVECAKGDCDHCEKAKPAFRAAINIFVPAEKTLKVMEGGIGWFRDVLKCREKYGLDKCSFEIERHGAAKDPRTTYSILLDEKLTDEQREYLSTLELHDLAEVLSGGDEEDKQPARTEKTIDEKVASELVSRLKPLPRETVQAFLEKFKIARLRELKARDLKAAFSFLDLLAKDKASDVEIDPFE